MIFVILCVYSLSAQKKYEVHIGLSSPSGDFADDTYGDAFSDGSGCAALGFNLGLKSYTPLKINGLSLFYGADLLYNPMSKDFQDYIEENISSNTDIEIKYPKYINIPIIIGLNQKFELKNDLSIYGEAGIGLNFSKVTDLVMESKAMNVSSTLSFDPMFNLCFSIGGGLIIQNKYTIGLNYKPLGSYKMKYKQEFDNDGDVTTDTGKFNDALDIKAITFSVGLLF